MCKQTKNTSPLVYNKNKVNYMWISKYTNLIYEINLIVIKGFLKIIALILATWNSK